MSKHGFQADGPHDHELEYAMFGRAGVGIVVGTTATLHI